MTTDDEAALLKDVIENPDDDAPRLAFADWCDRNSDSRGEFIRCQIELAKVVENREHPQRRSLLTKSRTLLARHALTWRPKSPHILEFEFSRGFIADVTLSAEAFLTQMQSLCLRFPIEHIRMRDVNHHAREVLTSPNIGRLSALTIAHGGLTDDDVLAFAESPYTNRLWWLDFSYNKIGRVGVEAMIRSKTLKNLGVVSLTGNPCDPIETISLDQGVVVDAQMPEDGEYFESRYGQIAWLHYRDCGPLLPHAQR